MKTLTISFLFSALLFGQAQPSVSVTPGAPAVQAPGNPGTPAAAPAAPQPIAPDTVVAEVNGKKYTAAEMDKLISMLPAQYQPMAKAQPQMLSQVFLMQHLAAEAEKAGLDKKSPYKEQLEINRMQVLSTAELSDFQNSMTISQEEQEKYYKDNPDKFKEVKVRAIYIKFAATPPKPPADAKTPEAAVETPKILTEAEAKAKIEDLEKQVKAGADFGKLARENSDDKGSAAKDGDFGEIKQDSAYPPAIKTAVFALKQGEVSAPIRQPSGFYLLRAEEVHQQPYNDVVGPVSQAVRQAKFQEWLKGVQAQYNVKIENPAYFSGPRIPTPLPQPH